MEREYDIWSEAYLATGMEGIPYRAHIIGVGVGNNFTEACQNWSDQDKTGEIARLFDAEKCTYWGLQLYEFEKDARVWEQKFDADKKRKKLSNEMDQLRCDLVDKSIDEGLNKREADILSKLQTILSEMQKPMLEDAINQLELLYTQLNNGEAEQTKV